MRLPKIDRILAADAELQPLVSKTRELRALAGLVQDFLPPDLARQCRVVNYRESDLVLAAAHAAAAAKLRLLAPALGRFLTERRWQVNLVSVRVQPKSTPHSNGAASQKNVRLSTATLQSLKALRKRLKPDSPARQALSELLARHDSGNYDD